ncbi:hypothetical protein BBJ28_00019384 [Nothophytophthora sp. Chile5]|nr:hypothetical protein BBJ28_00019384 [Nothophytophthora sp. Chile5]
MAKKLDEVHEHVVGTKRKRYVHSQVGMEKGRQLLQDLNIWVEPVPTVVSAVGIPTPVDAFDWESVGDGKDQEIALFEDQQRAQYREYMERNIGAKYPSELPLLPGVKMLIEVKKEIVTDSSYQALSELIALDLRSDDPVLTNLTDNWQFFWVSSEKSDDCATIHKATIKKPGEAFRVIKALLAQSPTADEVSLPYIQGPVKRRKLAQLLPCISDGGESGGIRECIERYFDIASVLGPDVEMARAVGRQIARSIPAFSMYS